MRLSSWTHSPNLLLGEIAALLLPLGINKDPIRVLDELVHVLLDCLHRESGLLHRCLYRETLLPQREINEIFWDLLFRGVRDPLPLNVCNSRLRALLHPLAQTTSLSGQWKATHFRRDPRPSRRRHTCLDGLLVLGLSEYLRVVIVEANSDDPRRRVFGGGEPPLRFAARAFGRAKCHFI